MKSSFSVLNALRTLVNVEVVTEAISGSIYKVSAPITDGKEHITLGTLNLSGEYLQKGYANVNVYVKDVFAGLPNTKRLEELNNIIIPLLDKTKALGRDITASDTEEHSFVFFELDSPGIILRDQERESTHFLNIKLKFQTL